MSQTPGERVDQTIKFLKKYQEKFCIHEDSNCSKKIINAHSIQNKRILERISYKGHVKVLEMTNDSEDAIFDLTLRGKKKACVFNGFCEYHDNKLFKTIDDNDYIIDNEIQEFAFAYRAFAREYYIKKTNQKAFNSMLQIVNLGDLSEVQKINKNITNQSQLYEFRKWAGINVRGFLNGLNDAVKYMTNIKKSFYVNFENENFNKVYTNTIVLDEPYLIAANSYTTIPDDLEGNVINTLTSKTLKPLFINIFPQNEKTIILIGNITKDLKYFEKLHDQINNKSGSDLKVILSNILLKYVENFAVSPLLWDKLDQKDKSNFIEIYNEQLQPLLQSFTELEDINLFIEV